MENRFKKARTVHNQHGSQTVKEVAQATGITKSLLEDLESPVYKRRDTGYLKVKKLAEYYGVSSDYLLGLSDTPSIDKDVQTVCKTTGLTEGAIEAIAGLGESGTVALNSVLPNHYFFDILLDICQFARKESTRKAAEVDEKRAMTNRDIQDFTARVMVTGKAEKERDFLEYRLLKKFKKLLDLVVSDLASRKDFQEYGARMAEMSYSTEAESISELYRTLDTEEEASNNGKH